MKKHRPLRRSVSPFGAVAVAPAVDSLSILRERLHSQFGEPDAKLKLINWSDAKNIAEIMGHALEAPANDVHDLTLLCQFLVGVQAEAETAGLSAEIFLAMEQVFLQKTETFLLSEGVLFSKERDMLIGRFFEPVTEKSPGQFSGFLSRWIESDHPDRLLHFFDFCKGTANPTFEYFLVFSNPAFHRLLTNKHLIRELWNKVESLIKKLPDSSWAECVRRALGL